jgi:hypothetical protein
VSLFLEMLQAARLAPALLGDSTELIGKFLLCRQNPDGGFQDRAGQSDLYYTVFGLAGVAASEGGREAFERVAAGELAPGAEIAQPRRGTEHSPAVSSAVAAAQRYLRSFGGGQGLDFIHLCCLARGWGAVSALNPGEACGGAVRAELLGRLEGHRSTDGGYHPIAGSEAGTAYAAFLALGAYEDLDGPLPGAARFIQSLASLETPDGAWTNEGPGPQWPIATSLPAATNATTAVISILRHLGRPVNRAAADWLLARAHPQGGFVAAPWAPMPDLLSTATALHALAGLQIPLAALKEPCLDFIDSLWTNEGGFYGHWGDDHLDCEYTFYALLALGHLSQAR